jgi:glycosyltransferase involved in cell wall biosynthesis
MPEVEFLLVGDGPLRAEIEQQAAALGLGESVLFLGDRRDIPAIFASSDISVLTSDSEGLSNVILEAMAAGVPVVAYAVGGNPEIVNSERGALIPAGNEAEFADAICRLLSDENLRHVQGHNARRFAEQNFSLGRVCRQYEALYEDLLDRKGRRRPNA